MLKGGVKIKIVIQKLEKKKYQRQMKMKNKTIIKKNRIETKKPNRRHNES